MSPTNNRLTPEASLDKEVSDDEDPSELKLQIELSEQQLSVLRKKVEELEVDNGKFKKKAKELQDKLNTKTTKRSLLGDKDNNQKLKVMFFVILQHIFKVILGFGGRIKWVKEKIARKGERLR